MSTMFEGFCAALVAVAVLALSIPNVPVRSSGVGASVSVEDQVVRAGFIGLALTLVLAVWIGTCRSRLLRAIGWLGLVLWLVLKLV